MGQTPIPRVAPPVTALEHAREDYAAGVIDLERYELQVEWLLRHGLGDSREHLSRSWPPTRAERAGQEAFYAKLAET